MLEAGTVLQGRYVVEQVLGQGGMGAVYLGRQAALAGKRVAIKEMVVPVADEAERVRALRQFQTEANLVAQLDHPGLVEVLDYFQHAANHYLVMSYVDGVTLADVLKRCERVPVALILDWALQICDVLGYLHTRPEPIIFRDLKPANIMLDVHGRIRLIDFGIARMAAPDMTTTTFIKGAGTPGFAPVEQYGGAPTDARSDVYALGATLYSLLTRRLPPVSVNLLSGDDRLVQPCALNADIPAALETVVLRMMALRKDERYQTVAVLQPELQAIRQTLAQPPAGPPCTSCHAIGLPGFVVCFRCGRSFQDDYGGEATVLPAARPSYIEIDPLPGAHDTVVPAPPQRHTTATPPSPPPVTASPGPALRVEPARAMPGSGRWVLRCGIALVALVVAWPRFSGTPVETSIFDILNVPFGLLGSLAAGVHGMWAFTLAPPALLALHYAIRRDLFGVGGGLYWLSSSALALGGSTLQPVVITSDGSAPDPALVHQLQQHASLILQHPGAGRLALLGIVASLASMVAWLVVTCPLLQVRPSSSASAAPQR